MRTLGFVYEIYDKTGKFKRLFRDVSEGQLSFRSLAEIKRTLMIDFRGDVSDIDFLNDRLLVKMRIKDILPVVPRSTQLIAGEVIELGDGTIEYYLGKYLFSSPEAVVEGDNKRYSCTCFDYTKLLMDTRTESRYFVSAGTIITNTIEAILKMFVGSEYVIPQSVKRNNIDIEFPVGTTYLTIANELLAIIGYTSLYTDGLGRVTATESVQASKKPVRYDYEISDKGIIINKDIVVSDDVSGTPNHWIAYTSNSQTPPLIATYTNTDPSSPTSTYNRGRKISAEPYEVSDIADQETLDAYIKQMALTDISTRLGTLSMSTLINPVHGFMDHILFDGQHYQQTSWDIELRPSGVMKHKCRAVI